MEGVELCMKVFWKDYKVRFGKDLGFGGVDALHTIPRF